EPVSESRGHARDGHRAARGAASRRHGRRIARRARVEAGACGLRPSGDRAAAAQAACDADPPRVSRHAAPADRRGSGKLGRRREGELLSRAGQPEAPAGASPMVGAHLTPQELVEVAERPDAAAPPHMERCDTCRRELEGLRVALAAAAEVPVPEPSPFFWERLSARVAAAVEEDLAARSRAGALLLRFVSRITAAGSRRLGAATAVSAALIAALVITFVRPTPGPEPGVVGPVHETSAAAPGDDAALALVAAAMGTSIWKPRTRPACSVRLRPMQSSISSRPASAASSSGC